MTHKKIINIGMVLCGVILITCLAVFIFTEHRARQTSDIMTIDSCNLHLVKSTYEDYLYSTSSEDALNIQNDAFKLSARLKGDFTVESDLPLYPFNIKGRDMSIDRYIYLSIDASKFENKECTDHLYQTTIQFHDNGGYAKKYKDTLVKSGKVQDASGQVYYSYAVKDKESSEIYGSDYYLISYNTFKNGIDYRFAFMWNLGAGENTSTNIDNAIKDGLKVLSQFSF